MKDPCERELSITNPDECLKILKRASWVGILGNLILSAVKIGTGFVSGSLVLVGDGIDSLGDVVTSLVTLYASKAAAVPPDPEHPWGHGRAETIATKTLSLVIIMAGLQLLLLTVGKLIESEIPALPGRSALMAAGISILGKTALAVWKYRVGKKTGSRMMLANAENMRNDIFLSVAVLAGIFFTRILQMPILDVLAGFCVSLWIIYSGTLVFLRTNTELMDSMDNPEVYRMVFESVWETPGAANPHRVRIRRLNALYVIDLDVEVDPHISVEEAHVISCRLEQDIRWRLKNVYDIMVHVEPAGVADHHEGYGLASEDID